jgi:hypothetical protein
MFIKCTILSAFISCVSIYLRSDNPSFSASKNSSADKKMVTSPRIDSFDYRTELLSPPPPGENASVTSVPSWRLNMDKFQLPERRVDSDVGLGSFFKTMSNDSLLVMLSIVLVL